MSCFFTCDNCGKKEEGVFCNWRWYLPDDWYHWSDSAKGGPHDACSIKCAQEIKSKGDEK